jgi:hypothetical protein
MAIELFIPPLPIPNDVKGLRLLAEFDVGATGAAKLTGMSRTPNTRYNRRLQDALIKLRFRPGTTGDGRPTRSVARITYDF